MQEIRAALAKDPRVGELGITVEIVDEDVYLRGTVATPERREAVGRVAEECCPGARVHNETEVEDLHEPDPMENLT